VIGEISPALFVLFIRSALRDQVATLPWPRCWFPPRAGGWRARGRSPGGV